MEWQCFPFFPSQPLKVVVCFLFVKTPGPQNWHGYTQSKCHFKPMTTFHIAQKHLWVFILLVALIYIFQKNHFVSLGVWGFKALMYLWTKVVYLFYFFHAYESHQTRMLQIVFLVSLESSQGGGVHQLGSMTFGLAMQKFLNIEWFFSLTIKLNCSWKFRRNWSLWCCCKDLDE